MDGLRGLQSILQATAGAIGAAFFDHLVKSVAQALGSRCAWVTECVRDRRALRTLSFWVDGEYHESGEYPLDGTPCATVIDEARLCHVPERVADLFPGDTELHRLGAMSYMGAPFFDADGTLLGNLAVIDDKPMPANAAAELMFEIFAERAGAEVRRLRRDRIIVARERKLSRLFDGAMDAIIELTDQRVITQINDAAARVLGGESVQALGARLDPFVTPDGLGKLQYLMAELVRDPSRMSLPIPGGLECIRASGAHVVTEGTLSRLSDDERCCYVLITRDVDDLVAAEQRIRALMCEADYLKTELQQASGFSEIIGSSEAILRTYDELERVAPTDATVLITGETGTGKELVARAIHDRSARRTGRLVTVNCAAIPSHLQESEFFGHERGAFTGASQKREGRFSLADGGTLFLDEVGELPLELQAKLLRVLQEGEVQPIGSAKPERIDVRVVAATNRNLEQMVEHGTFRLDLLYRLNVFPIHLPRLRDRGDDVVLIAEAFLRARARRTGQRPARFSAHDVHCLRSYDWPGNVRELQNVIERASILSAGRATLEIDRVLTRLTPREVAPPSGDRIRAVDASVLTEEQLRDFERDNLLRALQRTQGKIAGQGGAAELMGIRPSTLSSRLKALGIERRTWGPDPLPGVSAG